MTRVLSLLFHNVYETHPAESGFLCLAADRYKLSIAEFDAQLAGLTRQRTDRGFRLNQKTRLARASPPPPRWSTLGDGRALG